MPSSPDYPSIAPLPVDTALNTDRSQRCVIDTRTLRWVRSPADAVWRQPLERQGGEVARATSIVRYAAGAQFPAHEHGLGEEFLVLEGTFSDEAGDYPAGTYVKNPPGSRHAPHSQPGCVLFVKLRYLLPGDSGHVVINTRDGQDPRWQPGPADGVRELSLWTSGSQRAWMQRWSAATRLPVHTHHGGEEAYVLEGSLSDEHGHYPAGTWLRLPHLSTHRPFSRDGCLVLMRSGHLWPSV